MGKVKEFYIKCAEEAGLDPCEEETMLRVSAAFEAAPREGSPVDLFDFVVDRLTFGAP